MEKTNLIFLIINTIVLAVGGILGYVLIESEKLKESKSNVQLASSEIMVNNAELGKLVSERVINDIKIEMLPLNNALDFVKTNGEVILNLSQTTLNDTNIKLGELAIKLQKANAQIDANSKKTNISLNISTLIDDLQPKLDFDCKGSKPPVIHLECECSNEGAHKVIYEKPTIEIYKQPLDELVDAKLYGTKGLKANAVASGTSITNRYIITDHDGALSDNYNIKIKWVASLPIEIKNAIYPILENVIEKPILESLSTATYTFTYGSDMPQVH